jgi:hypothetical protein
MNKWRLIVASSQEPRRKDRAARRADGRDDAVLERLARRALT